MKRITMYINILFFLTAANAVNGKPYSTVADMQFKVDSTYIEGYVIEKGSNSPLGGIIVRWKGTSHSVLTNAEGRYRIGIHSGNKQLVFSKPGWKDKTIRVGKSRNRDICLKKLKIVPSVPQPEEDLPPDTLMLPGILN
ncbi:carboxypeptidase-like regulatory domain-containing protein [Bacteroidota bacterium]